MPESRPTITDREVGHGPSKGAEVQRQEPSEGVAYPQVEFDAGRDGVNLLFVEGNQPPGGGEDVSIKGFPC